MKKIFKQLTSPLIKLLIKIFIPIVMAIILNYALRNILNNLNDETFFYLPLFCFCLSLSIFLKIYNLYITKKDKIKTNDITNYRRDFDDVLSPLLAEALINQKIDMRELVMTQILELKLKGNIEIINNEKIELIHKFNLENHEKHFISTFFENSNTIYFKDINKLFKTSKTFIDNFSQFIYLSKINIVGSLRKKELLDLKNFNIFSNIRVISYLTIFHLPAAFIFLSQFSEGAEILSIIGFFMCFLFFFFPLGNFMATQCFSCNIEFADINYNDIFAPTHYYIIGGLMIPFMMNTWL